MTYEQEHGTLIPGWWMEGVKEARHSLPKTDAGYLSRCEAEERRIKKLKP